MKIHLKNVLSYILAAAMILVMLPMQYATASEPGEPGITLGSATLSSDKYYYDNATVTGNDIRTILISFSDSVITGDKITLPTSTPAGFTVSTSSASNSYTKRINLNAGIAASAISDYLRGVGFTLASQTQTVQITVTTEVIAQDTFYYDVTGHYYQFVPDTASTWIQAYDAARVKAYMGRTGYLATVTSLGEDTFVNSLSGKTGWLGGTILTNTGTSAGSLYYNGFNNNSVVSTGWYWACGPEKGTTFYNINSVYPNQNDTTFINQQDSLNSTYYNWTRSPSGEPNNRTGSTLFFDSFYETCLSTLENAPNTGKHGTAFTWNDIRYNFVGSDSWHANGYFVEYGDQPIGDSGSASSTFAIGSGTLEQPHTATVNTYVNGALGAAPGNVELKQGGVTMYTLGIFAAGVYTTSAINGTYNVYINNEDTGKDIVINNGNGSVTVNYYTVSFAVSNTGTASGSTVSATAGGSSITSGTAVLAGKMVTITVTGAGADSYTYLWSGQGTSGETTAAISIPALSDMVDALCMVTGTTTQQTYAANIYTYTDDALAAAPGNVELWQGGALKFSASVVDTGLYTASAANGTYDIYINSMDTGKNITISGADADAIVNYYTVSFTVLGTGATSGSTIIATVGGMAIPSGMAVLAGKTVVLTTNVPGGDKYIYAWSGSGTSGQNDKSITISPLSSTVNAVCTVTGAIFVTPAEIHTYTDGSPAAVSGTVELWQGGVMKFTAASGDTGVYVVFAAEGTYDIYINNEDTGVDLILTSTASSAEVYYYTVSFAAQDAGAAWGSTVSVSAGGTPLTSGTAVLAGKAVTLTGHGAGANSYVYSWSGPGINGEWGQSITIYPSGTVNVLCRVTGMAQLHTASIYIYADGALATVPGSVELWRGGAAIFTADSSTNGVCTMPAAYGTYDIYINDEDTGVDFAFSNSVNSASVYYYTVSFAAANAGTASGSTITATAGGTPIASGAAVLPGKAVIITAQGAGAESYTYLWSGSGTTSETVEAITIPSLTGTVNALCTVTGTTAQPTYAADIYTAADGVFAAAPGSVELKQGGVTVYTLGSGGTTGLYTVQAVDGTYDIYINNEDTGKNIIIGGAAAGVQVDYYTVSFAVANAGTSSGSTVSATAGGTPISSGTTVLAYKSVTITALGAGASAYTYLWSGSGTSGETAAAIAIPKLTGTVNALCRITGTGSTFTPGTITEEVSDSTISAEGLFTQDARLIIIPLAEGESDREELESLLSGKQTAAAFEVHVEPANAFKAPLTLSFQLGEQYNGRTVYILHKLHSGKVEQFTVVVTSGEAVITVQELSPFLLTVDPPVTLTAQPQSVTVVTGQTATFAVTATGTEPLTYQWQKKTGANASWEDIPGAVNPKHTTSQANLSNSGFQYRVIVTDAYGRSVTTGAATLTVTKALKPPATGDQSQPALYMALIILFMLSTFVLLRKRKAV